MFAILHAQMDKDGERWRKMEKNGEKWRKCLISRKKRDLFGAAPHGPGMC